MPTSSRRQSWHDSDHSSHSGDRSRVFGGLSIAEFIEQEAQRKVDAEERLAAEQSVGKTRSNAVTFHDRGKSCHHFHFLFESRCSTRNLALKLPGLSQKANHLTKGSTKIRGRRYQMHAESKLSSYHVAALSLSLHADEDTYITCEFAIHNLQDLASNKQ